MGFFSDLKEDLSQAVNELMPEEEQIKAVGEQDVVEPAAETAVKEAEEPAISLDEMLQNIDSIKLDEEDMPVMEETVSRESEQAAEVSVEAAAEHFSMESPAPESVGSFAADSPVPEDNLSVENDQTQETSTGEFADEMTSADVREQTAEAETAEAIDTFDMAAGNQEGNGQEKENKGVNEIMETMETMEAMDTMENSRMATDETAVITEGMVIKGDISTEGSIDVIGTVNGNIDALGKLNITGHITGNSKAAEIYAESAKINGEIISEGAVKIGASSVIIGNITAASAAIAGAVKGDIDVKGPVVLDTSAIVMGNIKSKSVQINNGAVIEGMCSQCYADISPTSFFDDYKPEPVRKSKSK